MKALSELEKKFIEMQGEEAWAELIQHLPDHMHEGVLRYVVRHAKPGSFLQAIVSNNLRESVAWADDVNQRCLADYVRFFYNHTPSACWGSPEKVQAWLAAKEGE